MGQEGCLTASRPRRLADLDRGRPPRGLGCGSRQARQAPKNHEPKRSQAREARGECPVFWKCDSALWDVKTRQHFGNTLFFRQRMSAHILNLWLDVFWKVAG